MNPMLRTLLAGGAVIASALAFTSGCVDNNATLFIEGVIATTPPNCVVQPDPSGVFLGSGTLDVAFRSSYTAAVLVGNQYTPRGNKENLRAETTRVSLTGAEVSLADSTGAALACGGGDCSNFASKFSVYGSGFVNSAKGADPGFGAFIAEIVPAGVGASFVGQLSGVSDKRTIYASIRVFGRTTGGQDIQSGELTFPIDICKGCLVEYPLAALTTVDTAGRQTCDANSQDVPVSGCLPGQDDVIDCRACASTKAICRTPPQK